MQEISDTIRVLPMMRDGVFRQISLHPNLNHCNSYCNATGLASRRLEVMASFETLNPNTISAEKATGHTM